MNLTQFFRLVTALKTACTHAGIDPKTATILTVSKDSVPYRFIIKGDGRDGRVEFQFDID